MLNKPLAILLNGLTVYQPSPFTPLDPLAAKLRAAGYETCVTNHFNTGCNNTRAPAVIIGHSQGGASALELARRYPTALVMTFDAVRALPCVSVCINFQSAGYRYIPVPGAQNKPINNGSHVLFVLDSAVQDMAVRYAAGNARRQIAERPKEAPIKVSTTAYWFDRWPNDEMGELDLSIEQLCEALIDPPKEVCP